MIAQLEINDFYLYIDTQQYSPRFPSAQRTRASLLFWGTYSAFLPLKSLTVKLN